MTFEQKKQIVNQISIDPSNLGGFAPRKIAPTVEYLFGQDGPVDMPEGQ